jgi:hypothetical protein
LLKSYNKLWVFGASNSRTNFCVDAKDSYWGLAAQDLKVNEIINLSKAGVGFDSIAHVLIAQQQNYDFEKDVFFIGIPPLERMTVFNLDSGAPIKYYADKINCTTWAVDSVEIPEHENLIGLPLGSRDSEDKRIIAFEARNWTELQIMQKLFLISQWLDSKQANYIIINQSAPFMKDALWPPAVFLDRYCKNHPQMILFDNTYWTINVDINKPVDYDKFGWQGHHGPEGNRYFYENAILPIMKRSQFC